MWGFLLKNEASLILYVCSPIVHTPRTPDVPSERIDSVPEELDHSANDHSNLHEVSADSSQALLRVAERFADIGLDPDLPEHARLIDAWSSVDRRMVFFSLATESETPGISKQTNFSRAKTLFHIGALEEAGLARLRVEKNVHSYTPSIGPLIGALGEESQALSAIEDYFLSANRMLDKTTNPTIRRHETMYKLFKVLSSEGRLKLYAFLASKRSEDKRYNADELYALGVGSTKRTLKHDLGFLKTAGLLHSYSSSQTSIPHTYCAVTSPFITVVNDFNDEFGEGVVVDLSKRSETFKFDDKRALDSGLGIVKALSFQARFEMLCYVAGWREGVYQSVAIEHCREEYRTQAKKAIIALREVGLIKGKRDSREILLTVNWKPLGSLISGLLTN